MATATVRGMVSVEQATEYLSENMGVRYRCLPRGATLFHVKRSPMVYATVRLDRKGDATEFTVHGGGFIIGRAINELTIARDVARALARWEPGSVM
ncbi:MAG: hypothetical protein ACHQFZ_04885 [Acidimicrobiales bacterium]